MKIKNTLIIPKKIKKIKKNKIKEKLDRFKLSTMKYIPIRTGLSYFLLIFALVMNIIFGNFWINLFTYTVFGISIEYHIRVFVFFFYAKWEGLDKN